MMADFIASGFFRYFVVPLAAVVLSIFVKKVSQNDKYSTFSKEDFAVGLELALTALLLFIGYSVSLAQRISGRVSGSDSLPDNLDERFVLIPWIVLVFVFGLWAMSTLVRKFGWRSRDEMNWACGVILPLIWGLLTLVFVVLWIR